MAFRKQEKTILIVVGFDLLSTVLKFFLAFFTGSLALLADAWHSLGDLGTSLIVLIALIFDRFEKIKTDKEENREKPMILRRCGWELRVSAIIGVLLLFVAFGVLRKVISGSQLADVSNQSIAAVFVLLLILISYIRFKFESSVGNETNSPALVADAHHSKVDMYVLALILFSLIGEKLGYRVDRWLAIFIGFLILGIGFRLIYRSVKIFFQKSTQSDPEMRTVEERLVVLFVGRLSKQKYNLIKVFGDYFGLRDLDRRKKLINSTLIVVCLAGVIVLLGGGFYLIGPNEVGLVEWFGCPVNINKPSGPGLHYTWPWPITTVRRVNTRTVFRKQIGYRSKERKDYILWTNVHYIQEYTLLTGDNTFLDAAANIHYRIVDPAKYLYNTADPDNLLVLMTHRSIRKLVGHREFFKLLTDERDYLEDSITQLTQQYIDELEIGVDIVRIYLRDLHPPMQVASAFEDVVSAQEDRETMIEDAYGYKKSLIPEANGEAERIKLTAQAERATKIMKATGESSSFLALEYAFQKNKEINKFRLKTNTMAQTLNRVDKIIVDRNVTRKPLDLYLGGRGKINLNDATTIPEVGGVLE